MITIPPAALEAGMNCMPIMRREARAAFLAMIAAWPEMERERIDKGCEWPLPEEYALPVAFTDTIILPLSPQEASDE